MELEGDKYMCNYIIEKTEKQRQYLETCVLEFSEFAEDIKEIQLHKAV